MRRIALVALVVLSIAAPFGSPVASAVPLSGRIVFVDAFGGTGIYTISPDGTGRTKLIEGTGAYAPKWLPDGSGVSFISQRRPRCCPSRLEAVDRDGSNRRVLLGRPKLPTGWKRIGGYDWSPDGSQLVLCLQAPKASDERLYVSPLNGSSMHLIRRHACQPDWSSQDRIAAVHGLRLIELDPDGSNFVRIDTGRQSADPSWSPDGTKIAFMCGSYVHADICVMNADGTEMKDLTNSDRTDWSPAWSPDGSRIVWAADTNTKYEFANLWRMRPDGSAKTRLTKTGALDEYAPDWRAA
jgi:TolB protein